MGFVRRISKFKKAISPALGMIFVLIIIVAVLIPLSILLFSVPTSQQVAAQNSKAVSSIAQQELSEIAVIETPSQLQSIITRNTQFSSTSPIYYALMYYVNNTGSWLYIVILQNNPNVVLNITSILGLNSNGQWVTVNNVFPHLPLLASPNTPGTSLAGYPAYLIRIGGNYVELAVITQLGNIIAVPKYDGGLYQPNGMSAIISLDPNSFHVLQNPSLILLGSPNLSSLIQQYGNTLTFYAFGILPSQNNYISWYYEGPMYILRSSKLFNGNISNAVMSLAPGSTMSVQSNNWNINITGTAKVQLSQFTGKVLFPNGTIKQYNDSSLTVVLNNQAASVLGSGQISVTNTQVLNVTKLTGNIENAIVYLSGNVQPGFTFFTGYMNGTLLSNIAIPIINDLPTGLVLPLITLLSSTIDGLSNLGTLLSSLIEGVSGLGNSAVSSLLPPIIISAEKVTGVNIIYLAAVTPEIITLKGVVYNPTSQLLYINYTYIMLQEYDTLSGVGGPTTLGQIVGMVQVPVNMYVYPGTYQDIDLKVGIPLTLPNVLLNNLLSNSDSFFLSIRPLYLWALRYSCISIYYSKPIVVYFIYNPHY
ncbi:hypothetical protein [Sulfolobus acidocaldarius]|nr:hypothetical protein [Sulfolobus acidocaldarius]